MSRRAILLLVNPAAGGKVGSGPDLAEDPARLEPDALAETLRHRGLEIELRTLTEDDDVEALARQAADERDVVVAGGDGTVALAAAGLAGTDAILGILARGSFNNVAHGFNVPLSLDSAVEVIARGTWTAMDMGVARHGVDDADDADEQPFFEAAGVGLDAAGFGAVELSERRGWWRGLRVVVRALRQRRRAMRLTIDDERFHTRAPAVTVCNGPYLGMGFVLAADADPADGQLDVAIFSHMSRWEVLAHFARVARGVRRREPRITRRQAREITVEAVNGVLPAHADGRSVGTTPVTFSVRPGALRVFR